MDNSIHKFWFSNENLWFNSLPKDDIIIENLFSEFLINPPSDILERIILYDQLVRHIYRNDHNKIKEFLPLALKESLYILDNCLDYNYLPEERCFILMPLRHTFQLEYLERAFDKIKEYRMKEDSKYYIRFYKATILSMSKIKTYLVSIENIKENISNQQIFETLDKDCIKNLTEILPFTDKSEIYCAFDNTLRKIKDLKEITLSLSGGVDSMVSSYILYNLSKNQKKFKIVAVSINYNNREDNCLEMEFIKRWCKLLGIDHYIRHITELVRDRSHDRNIYEDITKKIRFDIYKRFGNPVILGHNQDDCFENIINNIKKARSYDNLKGMSEFSEDSGVILVRPMLDIKKKDIKEFAKKYKIPHLPNSTPNWSERGKIREELIPFLNQFDSGIIPGLLQLANSTKEIYGIYDKSVIDNFFKNIVFDNNKVIIRMNDNCYDYGLSFWKDIIIRIFKMKSNIIPTNKSIKAFSDRLIKKQYGKINFSKNDYCEYNKDILVFVIN